MGRTIAHLHTYEEWLEILKNKIKETSKIPTIRDFNKYDLPSSRYFVTHAKKLNNKVKDFNTFIEYELQMKPRYFMSKEMATEIILKAVKEIGHSPTKIELAPYICESVVKRIWGTLNNMKIELGLEILGYNGNENHHDIEELKPILLKGCKEIINSGYTTITTKNIENMCPVSFSTVEKEFKRHNSCVREFLKENNIPYQASGQGYVHYYEDEEKTASIYEYEFTNKLREYGFIYNDTYVRDIRYKEFIKDYSGLLNCDYKILYKDRIIYVEIAGLLRDYDKYYYSNKIIKSKSKEKYRLKLMQKERMLKDSNLDYFILFPSDLKDLDYLFKEVLHINKIANER